MSYILQPSNNMYGTFNSKHSNGHIHTANGHVPNGDVISDKTPLSRDSYEYTVTRKEYLGEESDVKYKPGKYLPTVKHIKNIPNITYEFRRMMFPTYVLKDFKTLEAKHGLSFLFFKTVIFVKYILFSFSLYTI